MFKNKPVTLVIASGLMIVLLVVIGLFQFTNISRGLYAAGRPGNFQRVGRNNTGGTFPQGGNNPSTDGTTPNGGGTFQPGTGTTTDGTTGFRRGNFTANSTTLKMMQLLRGVQTGAAVLILALGVLSIVGMMLVKKWGRSWAIVTSILVALAALPSLFQRLFGFTMIETLVKIALAVAIMVLCLLPKSRQVATTTA